MLCIDILVMYVNHYWCVGVGGPLGVHMLFLCRYIYPYSGGWYRFVFNACTQF